MIFDQRYLDLDLVMREFGRAGRALQAISACEGAAGNMSVCLDRPVETSRHFPLAEPLELPEPVPALAGRMLVVTGSGCRLRELGDDPTASLGMVTVDSTGRGGVLHSSPGRQFARLTSEFNSHLAVHADRVERTGAGFHALVHAQPPQITLLSHIPEYRVGDTLLRRLLRWEPETIVNLPEGVGILPYLLPGSARLMAATVEGLRRHHVVVWSKHGVMARCDTSLMRAVDLIEYAETAARYECLDLAAGGRGEGLTDGELREIVAAFAVPTTLVGPAV